MIGISGTYITFVIFIVLILYIVEVEIVKVDGVGGVAVAATAAAIIVSIVDFHVHVVDVVAATAVILVEVEVVNQTRVGSMTALESLPLVSLSVCLRLLPIVRKFTSRMSRASSFCSFSYKALSAHPTS